MKIFESRIIQIALAAFLLLGIHYASTELPRDWVTWALSLPALAVVLITSMARAQDIRGNDLRSFVRRMGFILAGSGAMSLALAPVLGYTNSFPSWRAVILYWGFALTWLTTPGMPPWWKYISGEWKIKRGQDV